MQIHILSFKGPDHYARVSGLDTRMTGLAQALAKAGYETHLWFVGDPYLPGHETQEQLHLHRWCQWISRYHPAGVYDGEEGKLRTTRPRCRRFCSRKHSYRIWVRGGGR